MPKRRKTGYYLFVVQLRADLEAKGQRFDTSETRHHLSVVAETRWNEMTSREKAAYEEMARVDNLKEGLDLSTKFTTTGISYAQLERGEQEKREKERRMIMEIEETVQKHTDINGLLTYPFYFVHVNYYCACDGVYYPCEIALAKFTIKSGVISSMHSLIYIDRLPMGYGFEASKNSEETHEIPVPPFTEGRKDYKALLNEVLSFVLQEDLGDFPPLYTLPEHIDAVTGVLDYLYGTSIGEQSTTAFRIYPLTKLFYELRNACAHHASTKGFPVIRLAERELEKDMFNFATGIACTFHEKRDSVQYCSLSIVQRWCFLICDHCCQDVGVQLKPGKHVPLFSHAAQTCRVEEPKKKEEEKKLSHVQAQIKTLTIIDHAKEPVKESDARHFKVSTVRSTKGWPAVTSTSPQTPALRRPRTVTVGTNTNRQAAAQTEPNISGFPELRLPRCVNTRPSPGPLLRPPHSLPVAVPESIFSASDFPTIGGGVFGRLPAAVAGRGRGRGSSA